MKPFHPTLATLLLPALLLAGCATGPTPGKAPFAPPLGTCANLKRLTQVREAGCDYVEIGVRRLLVPHKSEEQFQRNLAALEKAGVKAYACNGFLPGSLKAVGPKPLHDEILAYSETAFRRAHEVGVEIIVFGSSRSRRIPKGFARAEAEKQFVALLKRMGPIAARYGITVVIEPLNRGEDNFINSLAQGAEMVRRTNHPNILLLADFYHMAREKEGPGEVIKYGHLLRHCHLAELEGRAWPGKKGFDFTGYLRALRQVSYQGRISTECKWKDFNRELPLAMTYLREQLKLACMAPAKGSQ